MHFLLITFHRFITFLDSVPSAINLAALVAPEEPRNRVPSVMDPNGTCTLEIEVDVVDQVVERRPWVVSNLFILFSH